MKIPRGKTTEVEARMATYVWLTMSTMGHERQTSRQTTQRQYTQWLKSLWIRAMHKLCFRYSAHDLDVQLSSCRCSHSSCYDCQQTVTNSATFHDMHHHHVLHAPVSQHETSFQLSSSRPFVNKNHVVKVLFLQNQTVCVVILFC